MKLYNSNWINTSHCVPSLKSDLPHSQLNRCFHRVKLMQPAGHIRCNVCRQVFNTHPEESFSYLLLLEFVRWTKIEKLSLMRLTSCCLKSSVYFPRPISLKRRDRSVSPTATLSICFSLSGCHIDDGDEPLTANWRQLSICVILPKHNTCTTNISIIMNLN